MRNRFLVLALLAAIVLNAAPFASAADSPCAHPPAELGKYTAAKSGLTMPATSYIDASGDERPFAALRGTGLIVNFWATWCPPCVEEMPALDRLAARAQGLGLNVAALSADREGATVVRRFYAVNGISSLPVAVDKSSRVMHALGIDGLPTTVLFDADGREVGRVVGQAQWDAPATISFLSRCLGPQT
ncbi:MAG: TlpA family protein disulfide reductase [Rhodospirillales bacterium]|nr:TlpA family protein disulfide reductase [Rhodospirillales bacterium]